jgi:hypothetical protein
MERCTERRDIWERDLEDRMLSMVEVQMGGREGKVRGWQWVQDLLKKDRTCRTRNRVSTRCFRNGPAG